MALYKHLSGYRIKALGPAVLVPLPTPKVAKLIENQHRRSSGET